MPRKELRGIVLAGAGTFTGFEATIEYGVFHIGVLHLSTRIFDRLVSSQWQAAFPVPCPLDDGHREHPLRSAFSAYLHR